MENIKVEITNKYYKIRKAQSIVEYAMIIACLAAALIAMQIYVKRSLQGRFRDAADEIGDQYSAMATHSSSTQTMNQSVVITGTAMWKKDPITLRNYEVTEVVRTESSNVAIPAGSYEETGKLSDEQLYDYYGSSSSGGSGGTVTRY